jgi:hypothetical protein
MRIRAGVILLIASLPALAQSHAFVYLAPGGQETGFPGNASGDVFAHFGGGGEYVTKSGIGIGADAGAMGFLFGGTFGTFSVDGSYHFRYQKLVDPFVFAGYSVFFDRNSGSLFGTGTGLPSQNLFNFGGGTNLWFSRHVGAKIAFRDHLHSENGSTVHYGEFMLGLGFH